MPRLQELLDHTCEIIDYYEQNPTAPNAALYVQCYCDRAEAIQKLIFQEQKQNFYS